jgi:uncharacterized membrane protein HdeD (DUF308 family)
MMNLPLIIACPGGPAIFLILLVPLIGLIPGILSVALGVSKRKTRISVAGAVAGGISLLIGVALVIFIGWPDSTDDLQVYLIYVAPVPLGVLGLWFSLRRQPVSALKAP